MSGGSQGPARDGALRLPPFVRDDERDYVRRRRKRVGLGEDGPTVGLALSGGGIRSATFCLGVLQTLAERGLLRLVDLLSTVSGGGYIGSCLTSLLAGRNRSGHGKDKAFDPVASMPLLDAEQIHHLRRHGEFLMVRSGLFRRETLRVVGAVLLGLACTLGSFLLLLAAVVGILIGTAGCLGGEGFRAAFLDQDEGVLAAALDGMLAHGASTWTWLAAGGVGLVTGVVLVVRSTRRTLEPIAGNRGDTGVDRAERRLLRRFTVVMALVGMVPPLALTFARGLRGVETGMVDPMLFVPAAVFAGALVGVSLAVLVYTLCGEWPGIGGDEWTSRSRSIQGSCIGLCGLLLGAWAVVLGLLWAMWWLRDAEWSLGAGGLVTLILTRLFSRVGGEAKGKVTRWYARLKPGLLAGAVPLFLVVTVVGIGVLVLGQGTDPAGMSWRALGFSAGGIAGFAVLMLIVDFDRIAPHVFYRDRLAEAFLKTEAVEDGELKEVRDDSELRLEEINEPGDPGPYHLFVTALNLPGSRDLARRSRKSDHFVFSRHWVGSSTTGYARTATYRTDEDGEHVRLGKVMALSGAAVASGMGFYTSATQAFATTLFNVRLGQWLPHPGRLREPAGERRGVPGLSWIAGVLDWPRWLLRELTALADARGRQVNLSDGGHTGDNLGIYPLLQRRCDVIVAIDAERDPDYAFPSLTAALRQIYTDENVVVDIDLDRIRPERPGEPCRSPWVVGRIDYPEAADAPAGDPDAGAKEGWLVVVKSSLPPDGLPAIVQSHAPRHPGFPHDTTMDQFFDDDQFEAYRALGAHLTGRWADRGGWPMLAKGEEAGPPGRALRDWCRREYAAERREPATGRDAPARPRSEKEAIRKTVADAGSLGEAAAALGLSVGQLRYRMRKHGVSRKRG